jgi:hypothetical protein
MQIIAFDFFSNIYYRKFYFNQFSCLESYPIENCYLMTELLDDVHFLSSPIWIDWLLPSKGLGKKFECKLPCLGSWGGGSWG